MLLLCLPISILFLGEEKRMLLYTNIKQKKMDRSISPKKAKGPYIQSL